METIDDPQIAKDFLDLPSHTQQVERAIKDLTFVTMRHPVENRDSVLNIIQSSREKMPYNLTKKDYNHFLPFDKTPGKPAVNETVYEDNFDATLVDWDQSFKQETFEKSFITAKQDKTLDEVESDYYDSDADYDWTDGF